MIGYSEGELFATRIGALVHPEDVRMSRVRAHQLLAGECEAYQLEQRYLRKDGSALWVLQCVSLVHAAAGTPLHHVVQIQDISAQKEAAQVQRQAAAAPVEAAQLAAQANRAKSEFLANMSHEIRTPLNVPVTDGYVATTQIRAGAAGEASARVPIIAMTANALAGDRERCLIVGMDDYVSKPVDPAKLCSALERALDHRPTDAATQTPDRGAGAGSIRDAGKFLHTVGDDVEFANDVLQVFLDSSATNLNALGSAMVQDAGTVARLAHALKGAAANIAACQMAAAAAQLEAAARDGGALAAMGDALLTAWGATERLIRQHLAAAQASGGAERRHALPDRT